MSRLNTVDPRAIPASFLTRSATDPATSWPGAPPNFGEQVVPHIMTISGRIGTRAYQWADEALRDSRINADKMRTDCGIMECVEARQRAVALLNWHIVPEDGQSIEQKQLADEMTRIVRRTPDFTKLRWSLADCHWYGRAAVAPQFGKDWVGGKMRTLVKRWEPRHGDKLVFRWDDGSKEYDPDQVGIRITGGYHELPNADYTDFTGQRRQKIEGTQYGLVYWLDEWERKLIVIDKHIIEDGPFEDPIRAGAIHGVGIRDRIYWTWYGMIECLADVLSYLERSAFGVEIWSYPAGNEKARTRCEDAAKRVTSGGRTVLIVPKERGEGSEDFGVQHIEPGLGGVEQAMSVIKDFFGHKIKRYILGQILTSEAAGTGLGSGVADAHMATFADIVKFDAVGREETITRELLRPLQIWNFPKSRGIYLRFVIDTESPDADRKMQGYRSAWDMGARLKEEEVLSIIGASMPKATDRVLQNPQMAQQPMQIPGDGIAGAGQAGQPADELHHLFGPLADLVGGQPGGQEGAGPGGGPDGGEPPPNPSEGGGPAQYAGPDADLEKYARRRQIRSSPGQQPLPSLGDQNIKQHHLWKEQLHPRGPKGSPTGGQFVSKSGSTGSGQAAGASNRQPLPHQFGQGMLFSELVSKLHETEQYPDSQSAKAKQQELFETLASNDLHPEQLAAFLSGDEERMKQLQLHALETGQHEPPGDMLEGGKADNIPASSFDPQSIEQGAKVEAEHTSDPAVAAEIARDHLTEDPGYYDKLAKMESGQKPYDREAAAKRNAEILANREAKSREVDESKLPPGEMRRAIAEERKRRQSGEQPKQSKTPLADAYKEMSKREDEGGFDTHAREAYAGKIVSYLDRHLKPGEWKTSRELEGGPYRKISHGRVGDDLSKLARAGHLQLAWDKQGYPHYALNGTEVPDWLSTTEADPAVSRDEDDLKRALGDETFSLQQQSVREGAPETKTPDTGGEQKAFFHGLEDDPGQGKLFEGMDLAGQSAEESASAAARPETYLNGDRAEYTGNMVDGFHEVEMMEGRHKGQTKVTSRAPDGTRPTDGRFQQEWKEQQEGFRRLREGGEQSTKGTDDQGRETKTTADGTVWARAKAGGEVSPVTGGHFKGGQWMPVHGLSQKRQPGAGKGVASPPAKPNENAKKQPEPRRLSPEEIADQAARKENLRKWGEINAGPLGQVKWLGDSPNEKAVTDTRTNLDKWKEYAASLGPEGVKRLVEKLEPIAHKRIDEAVAAAHAKNPDFDPDEAAAWEKSQLTERGSPDSGYFRRNDKSHEKQHPGSLYARELVQHLLDAKSYPAGHPNSVDHLHEVNRLMAEAQQPAELPAVPAEAVPPQKSERPEAPQEQASAGGTSEDENLPDTNTIAHPDEIPYDTAYRAHQGTSFVPETRAKQRQQDYADTINGDYKNLLELTKNDEERKLLADEFARYKDGYRRHYLEYLHANSRIVSSMIAGPSKFPARQMEKRNATAQKRSDELTEFRKRALAAIRKKIRPETSAIKSTDKDAVENLQKKLKAHEDLHARMKAVNAAHKKFLKDPASLEKADLSDADKALVRNYKPAYSWEPHPFPPYRLTNNNATIKQVKDRIAAVSKLQSSEAKEEEHGGVKLVENPDLGRIQLVFPGKPDEATRSALKSAGFRWAPSEGAWQRHLNESGRAAANRVLESLKKGK